MWAQGTLDQKTIRQALHTQSWERATAIVAEWTAHGGPAVKREPVSVSEAINEYLREGQAQGLSAVTQYHRLCWTKQFEAFISGQSVKRLDEVSADLVRKYLMHTPGLQPSTRQLERMRLIAFCSYCKRRKWISENPAKETAPFKVRSKPTDYLTPDEFNALVSAIDEPETRAFTLLLRWSGLRIGDGSRLKRDRIDQAGVLMLSTAKTNTPIRIPLPAVCVDALRSLPTDGPHFFMATGERMASVRERFRARLAVAWTKTGLAKRFHPHMLRDTFAVEMLLKGVSIELVSKLLGHSSIRVTERHYAPWVKARQDQLEMAVKAAWLT
jgi:integrase/recombinase XerD